MGAKLLHPASPRELADALAGAAAKHRSITLLGNSTKLGMAGPVTPSDVTISTRRMDRLIQYEPRDLTVSVHAGMRFADLTRILAERKQMIPLDPPFADDATVGGVLAANQSGPRRRMYGTARDLVIGMTFATIEGTLIRTGGMVVKNVAGLDMAKMMIGSFGTLAAIATVNFRVHPTPPGTRTFVRKSIKVGGAMAVRDFALKSVVSPVAIDVYKTAEGYQVLVQVSGSPAVLDRCSRELSAAKHLEGAAEAKLWESIRELTPRFLARHPQGAVVRVPCKLSEVGQVLERMPAQAVARAGSGVVHGYFPDAREAVGKGLIEFATPQVREENELWPVPGDGFEMMKRVKRMFDPESLLNRGRLYGRI